MTAHVPRLPAIWLALALPGSAADSPDSIAALRASDVTERFSHLHEHAAGHAGALSLTLPVQGPDGDRWRILRRSRPSTKGLMKWMPQSVPS